jgi:L-glutamine:2-deoxy-scyllo-inosose/3-amino-2,3-dideoxy-scyllo-inosose aminotransferase
MPSPSTTTLAINGATPVRRGDRPWPRWPQPAAGAQEQLTAVLRSARWAISSPCAGELFERRFARRFAEYVGARHCVPTDHGSSALVIALESLGLNYGDTVLVPALTWTASATAVFRAGLVPVLCDVDPATGCLDPATLALDVDARAVIVVHWACAMADIPSIEAVTAPRGMSVIEDAAQAHGARWQGRAAGSLGRLGCFSMQHGKVLTCGEGGAVVTSDDILAPRLEELRADSRRFAATTGPGRLELAETASVMGANFCLGEFGAALLCAQLDELDGQHAIRARNYARLADQLDDVPGVRLLRHSPKQDALSLYEVPIVFDRLPAGVDNEWLAMAVERELGLRAYPPRTPLHRSPLLRPQTKATLGPLAEKFAALHRDRTYPGAEYLAAHAIQVHHSTFLGVEEDMVDLAAAVAKVAAAVAG